MAPPLESPAEEVTRLRDSVNDLRERVAQRTRELAIAHEALHESERNSRLLVDGIPGLVALLTAAGEVQFVNRQIVEYTGRTLEELKHWGTNDTVHPEDLPRVIQVFTQSIGSGTPYQIVQRLRRSDGLYHWFQNNGFPLRDESGQIDRWCVLLTDIDERRRAEDALRESERELRLIVDSIPGLVAAFTANGELEFVNRPILDYFGKTFEELKQWGSAGTTHPEDLPRIVELFTRSIVSGEPFEFEVRARRFDGVYRWFQSRGLPLRDTNGHIVRWYNLLIDIDERKRAEQDLQRSEARKTAILESALDCIVTIDHEGFITEFNPAAERTFGCRRDEVLGRQLAEVIVPAALRDRHRQGLARYLATGEARVLGRRVEMIAVRGDGSEFPVELAITRIPGDGPPSFTGYLRDLTERKRSEEQLAKVRSELASVARATSLGVLTASIAHEVNQPLAGIITNASTCLRMLGADPPDVDGARETARRTIRDGNRAADVMTRLRALFSKREFSLEPLDLNEATREVIALSLSDLQRRRTILQSELAGDLPIVTGDRIQLQQVILNLLRNASEAMVEVHERPRLLLIKTEREDGNRVRLTVRDAGIGLPPQSPDSVFDAFYTTKSSGMGIGLFVSRSIVERHQGRLWAEPNDGPGATFSFSIPFQRA